MKRVLFANLVALVCFFVYSAISSLWAPYGGTSSKLLLLELPLVLVLSNVGYFARRDPNQSDFLGASLALVPWLAIYMLVDFTYRFMHRCPRLSDLVNIPALLEVSLALAGGFAIWLLVIVAGSAVAIARWAKSPSQVCVGLSVRASVMVLLFLFLGSPVADVLIRERLDPVEWSPVRSMRKVGRIVSVVFFSHQRSEALKKLHALNLEEDCPDRWLGSIQFPRNIHIVVLESFADPRLFRNLSFDREPLHEGIRQWLDKKGRFELARAPVYGSGTAQSEFEILCGVRARAVLSSIEFTVLEGHAVSSIVHELRHQGYRTMATIGTGASFYNSKLAYRSLGFESTVFLDEEDGFRKPSDEKYIFDGDLLAKNVEIVKTKLEESGTPVFNYVLGMYGHYPFDRYPNKRPDVSVASLNGKPNELMTRVANQFYYRTGAIADFIAQVRSIDPNSIILVISDHLPPVFGASIEYSMGDKVNIGLMLDGPRPVSINRRPYFELPYLIWERLTDTNSPVPELADLDTCYYRLLAEGIGILPQEDSPQRTRGSNQ